MKNADSRLTRLEQSAVRAAPGPDYRETPAFLAMSDADQQKLQALVAQFNADGHLREFTNDDLAEFERLLIPLAQEERVDAEQL